VANIAKGIKDHWSRIIGEYTSRES